jgi:hypothetical protein
MPQEDLDAMVELVRTAALARFRILRTEGEERPDGSWLQLTCHVHREDVAWAAVPMIYAIGALSFADARPRGSSGLHFEEDDQWRVADMAHRLRFDRGSLVFDADYVRGRMMKTTVSIGPTGRLVIRTRNRHEMAVRWLRSLRGKKHLRLVESRDSSRS